MQLHRIKVIQGQGHARSRSSNVNVFEGQGHQRSGSFKFKVTSQSRSSEGHSHVEVKVIPQSNFYPEVYDCLSSECSSLLVYKYIGSHKKSQENSGIVLDLINIILWTSLLCITQFIKSLQIIIKDFWTFPFPVTL